MHVELIPELATIPAGDFLMGSDDGEEDERSAHRVHLDEFHIGVQQVTNADWLGMSGCSGRAIAKKCHPIPTRTRSGFVSRRLPNVVGRPNRETEPAPSAVLVEGGLS